MTLHEQLIQDMKDAMKGKNMETLGVLRLLIAALKKTAIDSKKEIEDEDVLAAIKGDVKKLEDALKDFSKAAREDLVEKTEKEIEILKRYLPAEMGQEELEAKIKEVLASEGVEDIKDMGRAMGACMQALKGAVSGNRVKETVEKLLK